MGGQMERTMGGRNGTKETMERSKGTKGTKEQWDDQ